MSDLPFPPVPSGSIANRTMQQSTYSPLPKPKHLSDGVPNILIVLIDDAGPAMPSTFGGEMNTPTMDRLVAEGISFNRFHTTAMCSPTRASLLTGRNHHVVANGQLSELANDWDGYAGVIPRSCALLPDVLRMHGYATAAWGKWHNTPPTEISAMGPFDNWPTSLGFEYFYGFLGGEASQYEPNLVRNTAYLDEPPHEDGYHLTQDLADDAILWLRKHKAMAPDRPFFMYWASGALHGPHHVTNEWADKYKGKFDDGWDAYRQRVFARAKSKGWIPRDAKLTPRHSAMPAWSDIPAPQQPFQTRLMEVCAGFAEHTDVQVGRMIDELDALGYADNTLVLYIWGDNGSSGEGQSGTIAEFLAQNGIPAPVQMHMKALEEMGGLSVLGTDRTENMFHAGWAWAGSTPYQGVKLLASHFGGTRNPLAMRWPAKIKADQIPRPQFHHVNDVVPTIYELVGISPPKTVNGVEQDPIDGVSMVYSFADPSAEDRLHTQYFEIMGSRGIYHDGWFASVFGPRTPWLPGLPEGIEDWNPDNDTWELYNLKTDWSQADDLAAKEPAKLAEMQQLFLDVAEKNKAFPIGGGLWVPALHPEMMPRVPYTSWDYTGDMRRIPELVAPKLGTVPNLVTIDLEAPARAEGVIYKLGGFGGGLTLFCLAGALHYEFNLFIVNRTKIRARLPLPPGKHQITVRSEYVKEQKPAAPFQITLMIDDKIAGIGVVPITVPLLFTGNECLDIGIALGSPVSDDYYDMAPFPFNGTIERMRVEYLETAPVEDTIEEPQPAPPVEPPPPVQAPAPAAPAQPVARPPQQPPPQQQPGLSEADILNQRELDRIAAEKDKA